MKIKKIKPKIKQIIGQLEESISKRAKFELMKELLTNAHTIIEPYPLDKKGNYHENYHFSITKERLKELGIHLNSKLLKEKYESPFLGEGRPYKN